MSDETPFADAIAELSDRMETQPAVRADGGRDGRWHGPFTEFEGREQTDQRYVRCADCGTRAPAGDRQAADHDESCLYSPHTEVAADGGTCPICGTDTDRMVFDGDEHRRRPCGHVRGGDE